MMFGDFNSDDVILGVQEAQIQTGEKLPVKALNTFTKATELEYLYSILLLLQ